MKNDAVLNLRVPNELKIALQRAADVNLRSVSGMATWAMAEWLTQHNFLSSAEAKPANTRRRPKGGR